MAFPNFTPVTSDPTFDLIATKMATKAPPLPATVAQFQQGILPLGQQTGALGGTLVPQAPPDALGFSPLGGSIVDKSPTGGALNGSITPRPGEAAGPEAAGAGMNWSGIMQGLSTLQPQQQRPVPQAPMPQQSRTVQLQTAPAPAMLPVGRASFASLMGGR